MLQGVSG